MNYVDMVQYGWGYTKRITFFKDVEKGAKANHPIEFMGRMEYLPILRVPIGLPKYRLLNGRTASAQEEYLVEHIDKTDEFFSRDPESLEAQKVQHELLWKLVQSGKLISYFKNGEAQKEPIILDNNGFVINGNRRLCAWRTLLSDEPDKYKHFVHIDVIVLPPGDDSAIDELEGSLQVQPDIREDYTWDSLANMMRRRQILYNLDTGALALRYKLKEPEVKELFDMLDYAEYYLHSRGIPKKWSVVSADKSAFQAIVKGRQELKLSTAGDKRLFEEAAFTLIDNSEGGRLYDAIPLIKKYQLEIQEALLNEFPISATSENKNESTVFGAVSISQSLPLAETISKPENREKAREIIRETIESQKEINKGKNSADYLLKQLKKANGTIQGAITGGLKPETNKSGVAEQIRGMETGIERIKMWLNIHA